MRQYYPPINSLTLSNRETKFVPFAVHFLEQIEAKKFSRLEIYEEIGFSQK